MLDPKVECRFPKDLILFLENYSTRQIGHNELLDFFNIFQIKLFTAGHMFDYTAPDGHGIIKLPLFEPETNDKRMVVVSVWVHFYSLKPLQI